MIDIHVDREITVVTHSGSFHTDEVFAVATIMLALKKAPVRLIRTRDMEIIKKADIVVDVGFIHDPETNRYDHHMDGGAGERDNGIPYSSFGLVWKEYGEILCGSAYAARIVDEIIVQPVDAGDNGIESYSPTIEGLSPYILHNVTASFHPTWKEIENGYSHDEGFQEAIEVAQKLLEREIHRAVDMEEGEQFVEEAYKQAQDKRIVVVDGPYPWETVLWKYDEPLYIVKPDPQSEGKWKVKAVRSNPFSSFENRKDFPLEWAGKTGSDLQAISGVSDALFCHNKRFIAVAGSKQGALALAKKAVDS